MAVQFPERLGPFQVLRPLARGGMAELYIGEQVEAFDGPHTVVLKVWRPPAMLEPLEHGRVQELLGRLIEEGRLGSRLVHPNIVQTFGVHQDLERDLYYLVQEYVDGVTLGDLMDHCCAKEQHFPCNIALEIMIPVLRALQYAHHDALREDGRPLRVVHRDIKPDNIMISFDGAVKLVDFGVARSTSLTRQVTVADFVLGTRHYMAPEQVFDPEAVGHRTDLFTSALILFELCTLRPVFPRTPVLQEFAEALSSFRFEDYAPYLDAGHYPGLREVLARALQIDPKDRFNSAGEMADALAKLPQAPEAQQWHQFLARMKRQLAEAVDKGSSREPARVPPEAPASRPMAPSAPLDAASPPQPAAPDAPSASRTQDAGWDDVITVLIENTSAPPASASSGARGAHGASPGQTTGAPGGPAGPALGQVPRGKVFTVPTEGGLAPARSAARTPDPAIAGDRATPATGPRPEAGAPTRAAGAPAAGTPAAGTASSTGGRSGSRAASPRTTGRHRPYTPPGPPDPPPWDNERVRAEAAAKSAELAAAAAKAAEAAAERARRASRFKWLLAGLLVLLAGGLVAWFAVG